MQLSTKAAALFMTRDPHWKRKLLIGGALFFPLPPLGWVMALGFRSLTGPRLVEGIEPVLPAWRGNIGLILKRGVIAVLIILAHFSPFLLAFWFFGLEGGQPVASLWRYVAVF